MTAFTLWRSQVYGPRVKRQLKVMHKRLYLHMYLIISISKYCGRDTVLKAHLVSQMLLNLSLAIEL